MVNSYSIIRRTWKWTRKLFLHLLDLKILNCLILLTSCGAKLTHKRLQTCFDQGPNAGEQKGTSEYRRGKSMPFDRQTYMM
jgi:hypothetical protein